MNKHVVGNINGYDVIYGIEKDIVFCKNTCVSYKILKDTFKGSLNRVQLKDDLYFIKDDFIITLGCLSLTSAEYKQIINKIEKIKLDATRNK